MTIDSFLHGLFGRPPPPRAAGGAASSSPLDGLADGYREQLSRLAADVVKWVAVSVTGATCGVVLQLPYGPAVCGTAAIGPCCACKRHVCLEHAMVSPGRVICGACVYAAEQQFGSAWSPPPWTPPARPGDAGRPFGFVDPDQLDPQRALERAEHLRVLGLDDGADPQQIRAAYRRLAVKSHPDRVPEPERAAATARMKRINAAYQWLLGEQRRAA